MTSSPNALPPPPKSSRTGARDFIMYLIILLLIAGPYAAVFWIRSHRSTTFESDFAMHQQRIDELERKMHSVETKTNDLAARFEALPSQPSAAPSEPAAPQPAKTSASDLAGVQKVISDLENAFSGLQDKVKQSDSATSALSTKTKTTIKEALAFIQLREAATSGHGFAPALSLMDRAAEGDAGLKAPLDQLAPLADRGAPDIVTLRSRFQDQISSAEAAISKSEAETWWQRVLAELKGLISVRPLHGPVAEENSLQAVDAYLERDDLSAALEQFKKVAPEGQKALEAWKGEAEARLQINAALNSITEHLITGATETAPSSQDEQ